MEILQYIAGLVQSQREIGITGLGTIYKKKSPGRYDAATHSFLPPTNTISFKEEVAEEEILVGRVALGENVSKEAANEGIASFVESVKKQLSAGNPVDFSPLGTLKNNKGTIELDVQQDFNAGTEYFGLPKIEAEPFKADSPELNEPEPINQVEEVNSTPEIAEPFFTEPVSPFIDEESFPREEESSLSEQDYSSTEQEVWNEPEIVEETLAEVPEENLEAEPIEEAKPVEETKPVEEAKSETAAFVEEAAPYEEAAPFEEVAPVEETEPIEEDNKTPVVSLDPVEEEIIIDNLLEEENPGNETHEPQLMEVPKPPVENSIRYTIHEQQPEPKSKGLMLKVALTLLAVLLVAAIVYLLFPKDKVKEMQPRIVATDSTAIRRDSLVNVARQLAAQDSIAKRDSTPNTTTTTAAALPDTIKKPVAVDTATTFEIIGASVLNQKEADWFITQMKRNGITAKVVKDIPGKRLKMSIGTLHDVATAKKERDRLEKKLDIKGIYIYRNKK
jgi:hypothetical protein